MPQNDWQPGESFVVREARRQFQEFAARQHYAEDDEPQMVIPVPMLPLPAPKNDIHIITSTEDEQPKHGIHIITSTDEE